MAKRTKGPESRPHQPLALTVSHDEAEKLLKKQIAAGQALVKKAQDIRTPEPYETWKDERTRWRKFTAQALDSIYTTQEPSEEFNRGPGIGSISLAETSIYENIEYDLRGLRSRINILLSLHERLELVAEPAPENRENTSKRSVVNTNEPTVFLVHGHNAKVKEQVIRQLEKAGDYKVEVLHEQANRGLTLIEKFEQHASNSHFAVVLLTADDAGAAVPPGERIPAGDLRPRARQNVVFELGYFVGALGRDRVAVLYDDTVELPSDYQGIIYIPLTDETWRYKLLKELKAANLDYDLNKIL